MLRRCAISYMKASLMPVMPPSSMRAMKARPVLNLVAGDIRDNVDLPQYAI